MFLSSLGSRYCSYMILSMILFKVLYTIERGKGTGGTPTINLNNSAIAQSKRIWGNLGNKSDVAAFPLGYYNSSLYHEVQ